MINTRNEVLEELKRLNIKFDVESRGYMLTLPVIGSFSGRVASLFLREMPDVYLRYVGGLESGAILVAKILDENSFSIKGDGSYPFYVRKVSKSGRSLVPLFSGEPLPSEDRPVIIVDDVLDTGYSVAKAAKAVETEWGYKPTLAVVLVDNENGGKEFLKTKGIECRSIFTRKEILG